MGGILDIINDFIKYQRKDPEGFFGGPDGMEFHVDDQNVIQFIKRRAQTDDVNSKEYREELMKFMEETSSKKVQSEPEEPKEELNWKNYIGEDIRVGGGSGIGNIERANTNTQWKIPNMKSGGGIAGIDTGKDSVHALLQPGEYVFNRPSILGLGDGSIEKGWKVAENIMKKAERKADSLGV
tara:strand:+ start:740 stop:1285 length:546 start_codon:yes stop_codon:yes gene_type:complete